MTGTCSARCVLLALTGALAACAPTPPPETQRSGEAGAEAADRARIDTVSLVSGPSPYAPDGCGQPDVAVYDTLPDPIDQGDGSGFGKEADLAVAMNPGNPRHLIAAWVQDRGLGIVTAQSFDGGKSWRRNAIPELSFCGGAEEERASHAHLAFDPAGRAYLVAETFDGFFPDPRQALSIRIPIAASADGGGAWKAGFIDGGMLEGPKGLNNFAADPTRPGSVYVAWHVGEPQAGTGAMLVSRTTDGGASWTRHQVRKGDPDALPYARVLALRDGTVLMFASDSTVRGFTVAGTPLAPLAPPPSLSVQRSADRGESWSAPIAISPNSSGHWPGAIEAPDGSVYVTWIGADEAGVATQYLARSDDRGDTWSEPVAVARPDHRSAPTLAISGDGVLGVLYTDHRNAGAPDLRETWLAWSADRGRTWSELRLARSSLASADLGYFQDLAGSPEGFAAVFLAGPPLAADGPTDVVFTSVRVRK